MLLFPQVDTAKWKLIAKSMSHVLLLISVKTQLVVFVLIHWAAFRKLLAQLLVELASFQLAPRVLMVISAQPDFVVRTHLVVSACKVLVDIVRLAPNVSLTTAPVVECAYTTQGDLVHQTFNASLISAFRLPAYFLLAIHASKQYPLSVKVRCARLLPIHVCKLTRALALQMLTALLVCARLEFAC